METRVNPEETELLDTYTSILLVKLCMIGQKTHQKMLTIPSNKGNAN
jgi:hypothetical protein